MINNLNRDMKWISSVQKLVKAEEHPVDAPMPITDHVLHGKHSYMQVDVQNLEANEHSFGVVTRWHDISPQAFRVKGFANVAVKFGVGWYAKGKILSYNYFAFGTTVDECVCVKRDVMSENANVCFFLTCSTSAAQFVADISVQSLVSKPEPFNARCF